MTKKELITALELAQKQIKHESNKRHRELLDKVIDLYQSCLKKDLSDEAEKKLIEWGREALEDSYR